MYKKYILIRSFVFGLDFSFEKVSLVWFYLNLTTPLNCVCVISFRPQNDKRRLKKLGFRISIQSGTRHSCCEISLAEERGKQEMCLVQKKKERKEEGRICCRRGDRERPCRLSTCRRSAPLLPVLTPSNRTLQAHNRRLRSTPPTDFSESAFFCIDFSLEYLIERSYFKCNFFLIFYPVLVFLSILNSTKRRMSFVLYNL